MRINSQTTNEALWLAGNTSSSGSIVFGANADTRLHRGPWAGMLQTPGDFMLEHMHSNTIPTVAASTGAGTSPTISITGTDHAFEVTLTQGNPTATGVIFTVFFQEDWVMAPHVALAPANANAAALSGTSAVYVSTDSVSMSLHSGSTGLVAGTQYKWKFVVGPGSIAII